MNKGIVSAEQELTIRHLCNSIVSRLVAGAIPFDATRDGLVALAKDRPVAEVPRAGDRVHAPKRVRVEELRAAVEANYHAKGYKNVTVPKLATSNHQLDAWAKDDLAPFYRAAVSELTYEAWMTSHGRATTGP